MKWFAKSKTFWGGFLILLPAFSQLAGHDMGADVVERLQMSVSELSQTIGVILGLFGIRMAKGELTLKNPKPEAK